MNYKKIAKEVFEIEVSGLNEVANKINGDFEKVIESIIKSK